MTIDLPDLPYPTDALEPHIGAKTLEVHHGKHHAGYVKKLNGLIEGTDLAERSLEDIVRMTANNRDLASVFNNAAQAWNHAFYWRCLSPEGGGSPGSELGDRIEKDFGDIDALAKELVQAGMERFGSGWVWLVADGDRLAVTSTANAGTPLTAGQTPLLVLDVWEHAYYLDYQNRRADYLQAAIENLVDWEFVNANLASAVPA